MKQVGLDPDQGVEVLSNDFIRDGKQTPSDKGKYFGINRGTAERALGRALSGGVYDVKVVRDGKTMPDRKVYIWRVNSNSCTEGNTLGRREPAADRESDDWKPSDLLVFSKK